MIVIADTTPLNYLILIDLSHILHELFGQVIVPRAVLSEMESSLASAKVRQWLAQRPDWLVVKDIRQKDPTLVHLDQGERDAITLAQELHADISFCLMSAQGDKKRQSDNSMSPERSAS